MSFKRFEKWLEQYKAAWESLDPDAAAAIFTPRATYQVTPFRDPEMHEEGIRAYFRRATSDQRNVRFRYEILASNADTGICHWNSHFDVESEGIHIELDGIFVFELNEVGQCERFREWWHEEVTENGS